MTPEWLEALRVRRDVLVQELAERRAEVNAIDVEIGRHVYSTKRREEWERGFAPPRKAPVNPPPLAYPAEKD